MSFPILSPIPFIKCTCTQSQSLNNFSKWSKTTTVYNVELFMSSQLQWNIKISAQKADSHLSQGDSFHAIMMHFHLDVP